MRPEAGIFYADEGIDEVLRNVGILDERSVCAAADERLDDFAV